MANLFEAIEAYEKATATSAHSYLTLGRDPFYRHLNGEYNAVTSPRTEGGREIEGAISTLAQATLSILPNRREKYRGQIPDKDIDGPDTLTDRTFYFLYRLVGCDAEELAALVEKNAEALRDRHDLYWIMTVTYHYDPRTMLEDMRKGTLKPRKSL